MVSWVEAVLVVAILVFVGVVTYVLATTAANNLWAFAGIALFLLIAAVAIVLLWYFHIRAQPAPKLMDELKQEWIKLARINRFATPYLHSLVISGSVVGPSARIGRILSGYVIRWKIPPMLEHSVEVDSKTHFPRVIAKNADRLADAFEFRFVVQEDNSFLDRFFGKQYVVGMFDFPKFIRDAKGCLQNDPEDATKYLCEKDKDGNIVLDLCHDPFIGDLNVYCNGLVYHLGILYPDTQAGASFIDWTRSIEVERKELDLVYNNVFEWVIEAVKGDAAHKKAIEREKQSGGLLGLGGGPSPPTGGK